MARKEIDNIHVVTVDAIRDYHVCELFYRYRYEDELIEPIDYHKLNADRFRSTLSKVVSYYFYKRQAGSNVSYRSLLNRWEKLWFPKEMDAYDMAVQQHSVAQGNLATYSNAAISALEAFYNDFHEDEGVPVSIKEEYLVPLREDIRLQGEIDLVLRYPNGRMRVIKWLGNRLHANHNFMSMEFSALRFAMNHRLGNQINASYHLYDLVAPNRGFVELPQPTGDDMKALLFWATQIAEAESYVPRRGFTAYCRGCPFDKECEEYSQWPIIV